MISIQAAKCIHGLRGSKKYTDVRILRRLLPLIYMQSLGSHNPFKKLNNSSLLFSLCLPEGREVGKLKHIPKSTLDGDKIHKLAMENQPHHFSDASWHYALGKLYSLLEDFLISSERGD